MTTRRDDNRVFNELVLRLYRMLRVGSMHLPNNAAVHQAVDQCVRLLPELEHTDMGRLRLLFVDDTVYVNGRLLKADRQTFELAAELGQVVESLGFNELTISGHASTDALVALAAAFHRDWDGTAEGVDLRSIDPEALASLRDDGSSSRDKLIRTYTSTVVVMRWVYESLLDGRIRAPRNLKRLVQQLAVLADEEPGPFLHLATGPNLHDDDGGRAVKAAIVAIAMGRAVVDDVRNLARLGLTALLVDLGRTRAARLDLPADAPRFRALPNLTDAQLQRLPASTAAVLTAVGRLQGDALERARLAWLAQRLDVDAIFDRPPFDAPLEARIVRVARQWADALAFDVRAQRRRAPAEAFDLMARIADHDDDAHVVRLLGRVLELDPGRPHTQPAAPERADDDAPASDTSTAARSGQDAAPYTILGASTGGAFDTRDTSPVGDALRRWFSDTETGRTLTVDFMGPPDETESEVLDAWFGGDDSGMDFDLAARTNPRGAVLDDLAPMRPAELDPTHVTTADVPESRTRELLDSYRTGPALAAPGAAPALDDAPTERVAPERTRELLDGYAGQDAADEPTARVAPERTQELLDGYARHPHTAENPAAQNHPTQNSAADGEFDPSDAQDTTQATREQVHDLLASYLSSPDIADTAAFDEGESTVQLKGRHTRRLVAEARRSSFERAIHARLASPAAPPSPADVTTQPSRSTPAGPPPPVAAPPPPLATDTPGTPPAPQTASDQRRRIDRARGARFVREQASRGSPAAPGATVRDPHRAPRPTPTPRDDARPPRPPLRAASPAQVAPPVALDRLPIQDAPTPESSVLADAGEGSVDAPGVSGIIARRRRQSDHDARPAADASPSPESPSGRISADPMPSSAPGGWVRRNRVRHRTDDSHATAEPRSKSAVDDLLRAYLDGDD